MVSAQLYIGLSHIKITKIRIYTLFFDVSLIVLSTHYFKTIVISVRQNAVRTSLDFTGLLLVFLEIMPDKVILDHKVIFGGF